MTFFPSAGQFVDFPYSHNKPVAAGSAWPPQRVKLLDEFGNLVTTVVTMVANLRLHTLDDAPRVRTLHGLVSSTIQKIARNMT